MGNSRLRMIDALQYGDPDKLPVIYHPSQAGLYVHGEKLLALFRQYPPDNPITFDGIPQPPEGTVDDAGEYHELIESEWGVINEHRIFGVDGQPATHPFANWSAATDYAFPAVPEVGSSRFRDDRAELERAKRDYFVIDGWFSLFLKLCELRPMEEVLVDLCTGDSHLLDLLDRLVDFWLGRIEYWLAAGLDAFMFADDWCMQTGSLISPSIFRDVFIPRYERLMAPIHRAERDIFFHICGKTDELLEDLFGLGLTGLWPQIGCYEEDAFAQRCKERGVSIYIHPDRQRLVPRGTPEEIRGKMREYADRYHHLGGGGIFYVEIENDAPWENVQALIESIHEYR